MSANQSKSHIDGCWAMHVDSKNSSGQTKKEDQRMIKPSGKTVFLLKQSLQPQLSLHSKSIYIQIVEDVE